jgi:hypothetical protein
MAKTTAPEPTAAEITAARARNARTNNPLEPGAGTPWEDRGSLGLFGALVRTVGQSLARPGALLESMRRPETGNDARAFVFACGAFWGLSWMIHGLLASRGGKPDPYASGFDPSKLVGPALHLVLGVVATWGLHKLITMVAYKLISAGEMRTKFPPVLLYNVYAYALGPSVLAPIPYVGPPLALLWIFALFVYGARARLRIKTGGAIVCNIFAVVGVLGLAFAAYYVLTYLYGWLYTEAPPDAVPPLR